MRTFAIAKGYVESIIQDPDLLDAYADWMIFPGPELPEFPGKFILLTPYGGPGLELDGVLDARSWQVRCVGPQTIYTDVEDVANLVDIAFLSHTSDQKIGGLAVPEIQRVGGAPAPLMVDDAERVHFACSYIASVELALPN